MRLREVDAPFDDIEQMMQAVGEAVRRWEVNDDPSGDLESMPNVSPGLSQRASLLRHQWRIDGNAIIHSTRPRLGPWLVRFQRFVRRTTWWFLEPVVHQIRLYQQNSGRIVHELAREQERIEAKMGDLETLADRLTALEDRLSSLERRLGLPLGQEDREA